MMNPRSEQLVNRQQVRAPKRQLWMGVGLLLPLWLAFFALFSGFNVAHAAQKEAKSTPLVIGVVPYNSPRAIAASYQPLRQFLQHTLQREVLLFTAPSFDEFMHRALQGQYDLVLAPGHGARLLQTDAGWLPLVTYQVAFDVVLVKAHDKLQIEGWHDLAGRKLGSLGEGSLTSFWLAHQLKKHSIIPSELVFINGADSLAQQVILGRFDSAAFTRFGFNQLSAAQRAGLAVFLQSPAFLGRTYLLSPQCADDYALIRAVLAAFAESEAGQAHFQRTQLGGYRDVLSADLEAMEPYAQDTRLRMRAYSKADALNQEGKAHVAK